MAKNQKSYTPEFKQQIVDLYHAGGYSYPQLEREYGACRSTVSGWAKQLSPIQISEEETVTLKEFKAIQKERQRLKIENEILKESHCHPGWHLPYSQKNNSRNCDFYPKIFKILYLNPALYCLEISKEYLLQSSSLCTLRQAEGTQSIQQRSETCL